jgi:hypothetical protein
VRAVRGQEREILILHREIEKAEADRKGGRFSRRVDTHVANHYDSNGSIGSESL